MRDQVCDHAVMGWSGSLEQGSSAVALVAAAAEGESKRWRHGAKHRTGRRASGLFSVLLGAAANLCSSGQVTAHLSIASRGDSERRMDRTKNRRRGKLGRRHANRDKTLAASRCSQSLNAPYLGRSGEVVGRPGGASMQGAQGAANESRLQRNVGAFLAGKQRWPSVELTSPSKLGR